MRSDMRSTAGRVILGAVEMAVLFVPAVFLNVLLSWCMDDLMWSMLLFPMMGGVLTGFAVFSETLKQALFKVLLFIPVTLIFWFYLVKMEFYIRALNWVFEDYGEPSAGGNFATFILLMATVFFNFIGVAVGISMAYFGDPGKNKTAFPTLRRIIIPVLCGLILAAVLILSIGMPQYVRVYG
ncbi:MAG: hypothetical protein IJ496_11095 [Ruminococcus sp.]|nr:hypothetical protein [Ruminococcus sp.]